MSYVIRHTIGKIDFKSIVVTSQIRLILQMDYNEYWDNFDEYWTVDVDECHVSDDDLTYDDRAKDKQIRASKVKKEHRTVAGQHKEKNTYGTVVTTSLMRVSEERNGGRMMRKYWEKHEYRKGDVDHKDNHYMLYDWLRIDKINKNANRGKRDRELIQDGSDE